jgi:hypothetical protein
MAKSAARTVNAVVAVAFITFFVLFIVLAVSLNLHFDRKRAIRRTGTVRLEAGFNLIPVVVGLQPEVAATAARSAIRQLGGHGLIELADRTVVGWIGSPWTNISRRAEYQLTITQSPQPDGTLLATCHCQARFSTMFFGMGRCHELATSLAKEFTRQASLPPTLQV